jgi:hypothetical protein
MGTVEVLTETGVVDFPEGVGVLPAVTLDVTVALLWGL